MKKTMNKWRYECEVLEGSVPFGFASNDPEYGSRDYPTKKEAWIGLLEEVGNNWCVETFGYNSTAKGSVKMDFDPKKMIVIVDNGDEKSQYKVSKVIPGEFDED